DNPPFNINKDNRKYPYSRIISSKKIDLYAENLPDGKHSEIIEQIKLRKIDLELCRRLCVGSYYSKFRDPKKKSMVEYQTVVFPYEFDKNGNCISYKKIPYHSSHKIRHLIRTLGSTQIFPVEMLCHKNLVLTEGELDALSLISAGINAITLTTGAGSFPKNLVEKFKDKMITLLYDNDTTGKSGAKKAAGLLYGITESVEIAQWPDNYKEGYDIGDFFSEDPDIKVLTDILNAAEEYKPQESKLTKEVTSEIKNEKFDIEQERAKIYNEIYLVLKNGFAKLLTSKLAEYVSNSDKYPICSCQKDPGSAKRIFYYYEMGFWKIVRLDYIRKIIIDLLSETYGEYNLSQVTNILGTLISVDHDIFNANPNLINLSNCAFNLETFEPIEHSTDLYFTYSNEYEYDPNATCPEFERALEDYSRDEFGNVDQEWIDGFWEMAGYCLTGHYEIHKMFWLFGSRGSEGKSTLCRVLSWLVGSELTRPNLDPAQLSGSFYKVGLMGKRLAVTGELPQFIKNLESIKQLTGEDEQSTDQKFKDQISFKNSAKLVFSMNRLPTFPSSTPKEPIIRRIFILPFDNPLKAIDCTIEEIFRKELPGIFNKSIEGLKQLRQNNNQFTVCKRAKYRLDIYAKETNMLAVFVDSYLIIDNQSSIWGYEVWKEFIKFMDENSAGNWSMEKSNPTSTSRFGKDLLTHVNFRKEKRYSTEKGGSQIKYIGIRMMSPEEKREKFK
ncbi:phage/plasmid primase, P4 family, partial [Bacteroidota bacterium]